MDNTMQEKESHINDISDLDVIQLVFEDEITNYEITETENCGMMKTIGYTEHLHSIVG